MQLIIVFNVHKSIPLLSEEVYIRAVSHSMEAAQHRKSIGIARRNGENPFMMFHLGVSSSSFFLIYFAIYFMISYI